MTAREYNDLEIDSLDEISAVDNPAQAVARAAIFKRHADPLAGKGPEPVGSGSSEITKTQENQNVADTNQPALESVQKQLTDAQSALSALNAELSIQKALAEMSDAERALYRGLDAAGQEEFRKASPAARAERVRSAGDQNPVVYTSLDGESFRKNDDPRLVTLAKRADDERKQRLIEKAEAQRERLTKRAESELPNLKGSPEVKVSLLKAVEGLPEADRGPVAEMLKAANEGLSKLFETRGHDRSDVSSPGADALDAAIAKFAADHKLSIEKATGAFLDTAEGRKLYAESVQ